MEHVLHSGSQTAPWTKAVMALVRESSAQLETKTTRRFGTKTALALCSTSTTSTAEERVRASQRTQTTESRCGSIRKKVRGARVVRKQTTHFTATCDGGCRLPRIGFTGRWWGREHARTDWLSVFLRVRGKSGLGRRVKIHIVKSVDRVVFIWREGPKHRRAQIRKVRGRVLGFILIGLGARTGIFG